MEDLKVKYEMQVKKEVLNVLNRRDEAEDDDKTVDGVSIFNQPLMHKLTNEIRNMIMPSWSVLRCYKKYKPKKRQPQLN